MEIYLSVALVAYFVTWLLFSFWGMRVKQWTAIASIGGGFIAGALILSVLLIPLRFLDKSEPDLSIKVDVRQAEPEIAELRTDYHILTDTEAFHFANIRRFSRRIIIPDDRTRDEMIATLKRAVSDIPQATWADAIAVHVYESGQSTSDIGAAIAQAIYAPYGEWGKAGDKCCMRLKIRLRTGEIVEADLYKASK